VVSNELACDGGNYGIWRDMAEAGAEAERVLLVCWDEGWVDWVAGEDNVAVGCRHLRGCR